MMTKAELLRYISDLDDDDYVDFHEIEREAEQARDEYIEMLEERQEQSGLYAFQDLMALRRFER